MKFLPLFFAVNVTFAATITIDTAPLQEVVGFGAGSVYYQNWITALSKDNQKILYDTAFTGLNLSLLRLGNWLQDETHDINADVEIVTAAKERLGSNLKIEMSSWSAPANLKASGSINGNDGKTYADNSLKKSTNDPYGNYVYKDFADWWVRAFKLYSAKGIVPDYISFQNEPDMNATYEETLFTPTETDSAAGYKQALNAIYDAFKNVANKPKILGPEPLGIGYNNFQKYVKELDKTKLDGYAFHLYHAGNGNDNSGNNYLNPENFKTAINAIGNSYNDKPIIMTEFCTMLDERREVDMVGLAHIMQVGFSSGNLNGYIAWELFWGEGSGQFIGVCTNGWGSCKKDEITISPEYHAMRHFSKFVNPGAHVLATNATDDLKTVAFKSASSDSITIVIINASKKELKLDLPTIKNYGLKEAVQSKENGIKSKNITLSNCFVLPARSITTLVFVNGVANPSAQTCSDETSDSTYSEPVETPAADIVIVDYSKTQDVSAWHNSSDLENVTYISSELDGVNGYVKVPFAGCDQSKDDCGYKNYMFDLSDNKALSSCANLVITMRSIDSENAYVNVGGAAGSSWVDWQYGRLASSASWSETSVSLEKEGGNNSTSLTFNSNANGVFIAKIVATECKTLSIAKQFKLGINTKNLKSALFDINGNLIWRGLYNNAIDANETLILNIPNGAYILKTKFGTKKLTKK